MLVNTQKKIYIYIIDNSVFAAGFCIGSEAVFVFKKIINLRRIINLRSWEGGVKPVLDRPKQG
jgi:hypothetical protein